MELSKEEENSFITAKSIITEYPTILNDSSIEQVVAIFEDNKYHTLPVVHSASGKLLGSINQKDIMQIISEEGPKTLIE